MTAQLLSALERIRNLFGDARTSEKLSLLRRLERARLRSAAQVERLHEVLCFLRAYPDDGRLLAQVARMLARFERRSDFARFRERLTDTGITGTAIRARLFWPTPAWLARRWPGRLHLERTEKDVTRSLTESLPRLLGRREAARLKQSGLGVWQAIDRLRRRGETDAACLARLIAAMPGDSFARESLHDAIDPTYDLLPGRGTPSRTHAWFAGAPQGFQTRPLRTGGIALGAELARAPAGVRRLARAEGGKLLDLARAAMATRQRDLDAFAYGDPRAVRLVEDGGGLAFAVCGMLPERRTPAGATYGVLILRNGVPIGYFDVSLRASRAAPSFNIFTSFRGADATWTFVRALAMLRHVLGAESFSLAPYQLGKGNDEALASGAWWFYYRSGFRSRAAAARQLARAERAKMARNPAHRSSRRTLARLAEWPLTLNP